MNRNYPRRASLDSGSFHSRFQSSISGNRYFPSSGFYPGTVLSGRNHQPEPFSYGNEDLKSNYWVRSPSEREWEQFSERSKSGVTGTFSYFSPDAPRLRRYDHNQNQNHRYPYGVPYMAEEKTAWTVLSTFADVTSLQGVPYIKKANRWWSTAFWITVFALACIACALHIWYLSREYIAHNTSTKTDIGFRNLDFPSVTVCNMNPIRMSKLDQTTPDMQSFIAEIQKNKISTGTSRGRLKRSGGGVQSGNTPKFGPNNPPDENHINNQNGGGYVTSNTRANQSSTLEQFIELYAQDKRSTRREVGHQAEMLILDCVYNGYNCFPGNFSHHASPVYGNCYTFNSAKLYKKALRSFVAGKDYGLSLTLYVENEDYLPGISENRGAAITIHKYGSMSFPEINGLGLRTGETTFIALKQHEIQRKGEPYSTCVAQNDATFKNKYNHSYTREACIASCTHKIIFGRCDCFLEPYEYYYSVQALKNKAPCETEKELLCVVNVQYNVTNGIKTCSCDPGCVEIDYEKQLSFTHWPQQSYQDTLINKACAVDPEGCNNLKINKEEKIRKNFIHVNLYYRELNYMKIEEQAAYEDVQFLSDIGGTLGLWVGISILSMVEVIQLGLQLLSFWFKKHRTKTESYRPVIPSSNRSESRMTSRGPFGFDSHGQRQHSPGHANISYGGI